MVLVRRCSSTRKHKAHLWSRTTRKTVTEETKGDTFHCPGPAEVEAPVDDRAAQIVKDARSSVNWAAKVNYGPACECGHLHGNCQILTHKGKS